MALLNHFAICYPLFSVVWRYCQPWHPACSSIHDRTSPYFLLFSILNNTFKVLLLPKVLRVNPPTDKHQFQCVFLSHQSHESVKPRISLVHSCEPSKPRPTITVATTRALASFSCEQIRQTITGFSLCFCFFVLPTISFSSFSSFSFFRYSSSLFPFSLFSLFVLVLHQLNISGLYFFKI